MQLPAVLINHGKEHLFSHGITIVFIARSEITTVSYHVLYCVFCVLVFGFLFGSGVGAEGLNKIL